MKVLIVLLATIVAVLARPQFGGFGGSSSNAGASANSFSSGVGFGPFNAGFSGSSANSFANSNAYNQGFGGGGGGYNPYYGGGGGYNPYYGGGGGYGGYGGYNRRPYYG